VSQPEGIKGFVEGEHVKVTIVGRVQSDAQSNETLTVAYDVHPHATPELLTLNPQHLGDGHGVTVERLAPPDWPPRRGDVWTDRFGYRYFALDEVLVGESGTPYFPEALRAKDGPMALASRAVKS
jgi:hypothetical protein